MYNEQASELERLIFEAFRKQLHEEEATHGSPAVCLVGYCYHGILTDYAKRAVHDCALRPAKPGFWLLGVQIFRNNNDWRGFIFGHSPRESPGP